MMKSYWQRKAGLSHARQNGRCSEDSYFVFFRNSVVGIWSDFDRASSLIRGNKMPTIYNRWFLLQILLLAQHVFGHHYAHHQELESIIQMVAACGIWCYGFHVVGMVRSCGLCVRFAGCSAPHHTDNMKTKAPNTTGSNHLYNTLELLMMGIMVSETCWASNKICNRNHLLHLVGILFPHNSVVGVSNEIRIAEKETHTQ